MQEIKQVIFPDTNIFLHFKFFVEIPWKEILQSKKVILVIPTIISSELDKHKYSHPLKQIRDRANKVISKMAELLESGKEISSGISISFEAVEPSNEFSAHNLSRESQDDRLIASIIKYKKENPNEQVSLVTNDFGLKVKAHHHQISVVKLPETCAIAPEPDPTAKKIRDLERQLKEYESRQPKLQLRFENGLQRLHYKFSRFDGDRFIADQLNEIKWKYPKLKTKVEENRNKTNVFDQNSATLRIAEMFDFGKPKILNSDVADYNRELDEFYLEYEEYLKEICRLEEIKSLTITLEIVVDNKGNAPAEDIHIELDFPPLFQVMDEESLFESEDEPPEPPAKPIPRNPMDFGLRNYAPSLINMSKYLNKLERPNFEPQTRKWNGLTKSDDGGCDASFFLRKLNHGLSEKCPRKIFLIFGNIEEAQSFSIRYKIHSADLLKPTDGELHVINQDIEDSN